MREEYGNVRIHISITTEAGLATAFCVVDS